MADILTPNDQAAEWEDAHPIPEFEVPVGWFENESMANRNGTQRSLRSEDWRYHIELYATPRLSAIEGPYWGELRYQVGGPESFVTAPDYRVTGIEPGQVQEAVYLLVGKAVEHEQEVFVEGGDA